MVVHASVAGRDRVFWKDQKAVASRGIVGNW